MGGALRGIRLLLRLAVVAALTVAGWLLVQEMVQSGQLPARPLDLAERGLPVPARLWGLPTPYAAGLLLLAALLLFGEGGGSGGGGGGGGGGA